MTGQGSPDRILTPKLAPRELEILEQFVDGRAPKEIARQLSLSVETVRWYAKRIYRALEVNNRAGAVRVAIETGLVEVGRAAGSSASQPLRSLIGRDSEVATLADLVATNRFVTVVGMGGVGKTALASEVAARCGADGVFVYEARLQDVVDGRVLAQRIADGLGVGLHDPDEDPWIELAELAKPVDGLLVLDNFEQLLAWGDRIEALLTAAPGLTVLVTSRQPLGVSAEVVVPLGGLAVAPEDEAPSTDWGAIALFVAEITRRRPDLGVTSDVLEVADEVCTLVGGMPLAIVLAASWVDTLSLDQIVGSLRSSSDLLTSNGLTPARHRSVASVIDATMGLLQQPQVAELAAVSVFAGGFTEDAAEEIAGTTAVTLAALKRASLVHQEPDGRCHVHPLVSQRLRPHLEASGGDRQARVAHRRYFANFAVAMLEPLRGSSQRIGQPQAIEMMSREDENLRRAWKEIVEAGELDLVAGMVEPITLWMTQIDDFAGAVRSLRAAIATCPTDEVPAQVRMMYEWFGWITGTLERDEVRTVSMAEAAEPSVDGEVRAIVQVVAMTLLANLLGREQDAQRLAADLDGDPNLPKYWDVRRKLSVATLQARRGENEESLATLDGGIEIALAGSDFFGAHMMLTTVFFMALRAGRTDLIPVYERLAEGALARQPAPGTAQALNCAKGLLEVWGGDPTLVPGRVAAAEDIGGLQVVFFSAFPACLEALHAGLTGDLTGALQARSRIDDARVRPIRPEPVTYAEWGVSLAYASVGNHDGAIAHAERMAEIETAAHAFAESQMLCHVLEALRLAGTSPAAARTFLATDHPPTRAAAMYRSWEPLRELW